jgi:peptidoglycan/xylan/chitin deacetylase (PgdA/CDA1 family)
MGIHPLFPFRRALYGAQSVLQRGALSRGPHRPQVALTFDDGPDPRWTGAIAEILARHGARASFFMVGEQVERHPELARDVVRQGHEPCVHLYSHRSEVADDPARFEREVRDSVALITRVTGRSPTFLRFPFAHLGAQRPRRIERRFGLATVHWSFSSLDTRLRADRIARRVRRRLFPGAIVLLHDGVGRGSMLAADRRETVRALPEIVEACLLSRLRPVCLSSLFRSEP